MSKKKLGLWMTTALVAGTMIGSGIFLLPAALAPFGPLGLWGWLFSTLAAIFLALTLGRLSRRLPLSGGPYAYTLSAFGSLAGFLVGWGYWVVLLTASVAVAVATVGYLAVFWPFLESSPIVSGLAALAVFWLLVGINTGGVRSAGAFQVVTTTLKILPLLLIIALGAIYFEPAHFEPVNPGGGSATSVIVATAALTMWSFLGLESASVAAETVDRPMRNVPLATGLGVLIAAVLYIGSTAGVMALVPNEALAASSSPFSLAARTVLGSWGSGLVAVGAIVSCLGALNGLVFVQAQMPYALARDGLFPPVFSRLSTGGVPRLAMLFSGGLVTLLLAFNYSGTLVEIFTFLILLSTLSIMLPFCFAALSEIKFLWTERASISAAAWYRSLIVPVSALVFSIWAVLGVGREAMLWGLVLWAAGVPVYIWMRSKYGDSAEHIVQQ